MPKKLFENKNTWRCISFVDVNVPVWNDKECRNENIAKFRIMSVCKIENLRFISIEINLRVCVIEN